VRFEYDALNRPTRAIDPQGNAVVTEYDIGGRPIRVTDPNGLVTQYDYYDQT
jgi:YD repeat-containing protein